MEYMGQTRSAAYTITPDFKGPSHYLTGKTQFDKSYSSLKTSPQKSKLNFPESGNSHAYSTQGFPVTEVSQEQNSTGFFQEQKSMIQGAHDRGTGGRTVGAWKESNSGQYARCDQTRCATELMKAEAVRHCLDACDITGKNQLESTKKLADRIDDVTYWKAEVETELRQLEDDVTALKKVTSCGQKAIREIEEPLKISERCLAERRARVGVDFVDDDVDKQLKEEIANFKTHRKILEDEVADANNILSSMDSIRKMLEADIGDKFQAIHLDKAAHKLNNSSMGIQFYPGIENIDGLSDPKAWVRFSHDNILASQAARSRSKNCCNSIGQALDSHSQSLTRQWNAVNSAFSERIKQYLDAIDKLKNHLQKTIEEISNTKKIIDVIKKCLHDKKAPLKVAQTRIKIRSDRPNIENCRDDAHLRLVDEIHSLNGTVEDLEARLEIAEASLLELEGVKQQVEMELSIKTKSLFIDQQVCMGMRGSHLMKPKAACDI